MIDTYLLFFFNDTATTEIYTLSLHDALPISSSPRNCARTCSENFSTAMSRPPPTLLPRRRCPVEEMPRGGDAPATSSEVHEQLLMVASFLTYIVWSLSCCFFSSFLQFACLRP